MTLDITSPILCITSTKVFSSIRWLDYKQDYFMFSKDLDEI